MIALLNEPPKMVYRSTKKNESNQVGSGRVMSVTHDSPFFNPNDSTDLGNRQDKSSSDRYTESVYEIVGEQKRYAAEVDKIITDHKLMQKKMEIEKKYTKVTPNYEQLSSEASMLIHHVGSAYDS